jgi:uncharacterized protein YbjT (DUF2867 family)
VTPEGGLRIVVVGGTGRVGSRLCALLRSSGHDPVVASPSRGVDSVTGEGLEEALRGARVVVDVSNPRAAGDEAVSDFFRTSTARILTAEAAAGVQHHVVLSVVGCDVPPIRGYYRAKLEQERLVGAGPIPWTILRATQFFEFLQTIISMATDGLVVRLPSIDIQPVAAEDVAVALAELAVEEPAGGPVELAGPEIFALDDLARRLLAALGDDRQVVVDPEARGFGGSIDRRALLPGRRARLGHQRFDDWLRLQGRAG